MDSSSRSELPQDIESCHALIVRLEEERRQQAETIREQQETIDRLTADLALLKRAMFGSRRERFVDDPRQGYLFEPREPGQKSDSADDETEDEEPAPSPRRTSKGRGRRVFPEFLPRKTVRHELKEEEIPEELRNDPGAKRFFKKTSEQLEIEPASAFVIEHYQEVIVQEDDVGETTMVTAPKPPQLIDAYTGPGFWAYLTASRFADHLPYYRLEDILSRQGFRIGRSTQWRWMFALAQGVKPLVDLMRSLALQSRVLGVDETPVKMLGGDSPGSVKSYLWDTIGDDDHPYDCFYFTVDRTRDGPEKFLSGYRGYLQSDAYICYEIISAAHEEILKVGCWAHARRKFEEVHFTAPSERTRTALRYFQRLYEIEGRGGVLDEAQRYALRQRESKPIVTEFYRWLMEHYERELPKSKFRGAIGYMVNRWGAFDRYLECGAIPIDNNRTEAALKYAVLGRKAWLFFGNPKGGETAAALFTLTKSCNRHRVDQFAYLRDVYTRMPTLPGSELGSLLPDRWIKEHPEHLIQERVAESHERAQRTRARRAQRRRQLQGPRPA
jgi:transposase